MGNTEGKVPFINALEVDTGTLGEGFSPASMFLPQHDVTDFVDSPWRASFSLRSEWGIEWGEGGRIVKLYTQDHCLFLRLSAFLAQRSNKTRCFTTSLRGSPEYTEAQITWEYVSTHRWTKTSLPKKRTWVTSICYMSQGCKPPIEKESAAVGQATQGYTMAWAALWRHFDGTRSDSWALPLCSSLWLLLKNQPCDFLHG